jgi:hypothetical protein
MTPVRWLLAATLFLSGCAHNYVYSGTLEAEDSTGKTRKHLLYWNRTERPVWFDTAEGSVRMLPQCSLNTVAYDEQPDGIVFRARETDKQVIGQAAPALKDRICGKVLNAGRITDLSEGTVEVTVLCEDAPADEFSRPKPYLKASEHSYPFPVTKREVPNFSDEGNVPKRPQCLNP